MLTRNRTLTITVDLDLVRICGLNLSQVVHDVANSRQIALGRLTDDIPRTFETDEGVAVATATVARKAPAVIHGRHTKGVVHDPQRELRPAHPGHAVA